MKKALFTIATCFASIALFAQSRPLGSELSLGLESTLPVVIKYGNLTWATLGLGATLKYAYNFDNSAAITVQSGFIYYFEGSLDNENIDIIQIPIKAGIRYSIGSFYLEPQLGVSIFTGSFPSTTTESGVFVVSHSATTFTYAGNLGFFVSRSFDISCRYEAWTKDPGGILGLRLAYTFPFKK
jgi:hypothetical protein